MSILSVIVALIVAHGFYIYAEHQRLYGPGRQQQPWIGAERVLYHLRNALVVITIFLVLAHCFS